MTTPYTLTPRLSDRAIDINLCPDLSINDRARADAINRGLNPEMNTFGWTLTPVRCQKWCLMFNSGWSWDERGFYLVRTGNRYTLPDALRVASDMQQRGAA